MAHAEASARTVQAAVTAAAAQLGLRPDQVDVEVLEDSVPSTFGYIGSPARVRVTPRSQAASPPPSPASDMGTSEVSGTEAIAATQPSQGTAATTAGQPSDEARPAGRPAAAAEPSEPARATTPAQSAGSTQVGVPTQTSGPGELGSTGQTSNPIEPESAAQTSGPAELGSAGQSSDPAELGVPAEPSPPRPTVTATPAPDPTDTVDRSQGPASSPARPSGLQDLSNANRTNVSYRSDHAGGPAASGSDPAIPGHPGTPPASGLDPANSGSDEAQNPTKPLATLGAENAPPSATIPEPAEEQPSVSGSESGGDNHGAGVEGPTAAASVLPTSAVDTAPSAAAAAEPSNATRTRRTYRDEPIEPEMVEADTERAGDFLEGLLDALDVDGDITTWVDEAGGHIDLEGADLDVLVGSNGETLEALQELTRIAVLRQSKRRVRLLLDINGYRARQRDQLISVVKSAVERVIRTREDHEFEPMTPAERKIVHDAVAAIDGVQTESLGEEPYRRVVIRPA